MTESKYARIERERRFLVCDLPEEIAGRTNYLRIFDVYLPGTHLRLRRIEDGDGNVISRKFGQKFPAQPDQTESTLMTNFYLDESEYMRLSTLEGRTITKRRYSFEFDGQHFSIDVFEGNLAGLILCETELRQTDITHIKLPSFVKREVTLDLFFTGGSLANLAPKDLKRRLHDECN
jgi:CYTH domain-containing protein